MDFFFNVNRIGYENIDYLRSRILVFRLFVEGIYRCVEFVIFNKYLEKYYFRGYMMWVCFLCDICCFEFFMMRVYFFLMLVWGYFYNFVFLVVIWSLYMFSFKV